VQGGIEKMKHIELIKNLQLDGGHIPAGDVELNRLYDGPNRTIVEVRLSNSGILKRHHADVPITVLCLSGNGVFSAGEDLSDSQAMEPGTLITLDAKVEHEVVANGDLHLIVSKFKAN
jgi:quercetin dioxygenase-like cupin family protein